MWHSSHHSHFTDVCRNYGSVLRQPGSKAHRLNLLTLLLPFTAAFWVKQLHVVYLTRSVLRPKLWLVYKAGPTVFGAGGFYFIRVSRDFFSKAFISDFLCALIFKFHHIENQSFCSHFVKIGKATKCQQHGGHQGLSMIWAPPEPPAVKKLSNWRWNLWKEFSHCKYLSMHHLLLLSKNRTLI